MGILLHAELLPKALAHELGPVPARGARDDPAQHLGVHRAVDEALAVLALLLERLEEIVDRGRSLVARRARQHAAGPAVAKDLGRGVGVGLAKAHAPRHVHHLAHLHVAPGAARQFGHVLRDPRLVVDLAVVHELRGHQPGEGLGDREQQVRGPWPHRVVVALVHHAPPVQHDDGVGVGALQPLVHRDGLALVILEGQAAERVRIGREGRRRARAAPDVARGLQLAQMLQRPAHLRVLVGIATVHALRAFGRKVLHVAQRIQRHAGRRGLHGRLGLGPGRASHGQTHETKCAHRPSSAAWVGPQGLARNYCC